MKFDLNINQRAILEHGFDLDLVDGAIIDFCLNFSASCRSWVDEGVTYYWFQHENICKQLPILRIKPDTMYRRMKALCEKEFLKAHPKNKQHNQSWYALCPNSYLIESAIGKKSDGTDSDPMGSPKGAQTSGFKSEPSEKNPEAIGSESDGASENNPMYKNIIEEENKLNSNKGAESEILEVEVEEVVADAKKNTPNPSFRSPPSPDLSPADFAELERFTQKLQQHSRLLFKLSSHLNLKGEFAQTWIQCFVLEQWTADELSKKNDAELILHCQRWIGKKLQAQQDREQQSGVNHAGRSKKGHQQSGTQTGTGIDELAEKYFGT